MPVNLGQYREVLGVFNSRFIHIKRHNIFKNAISQIKVKQTIAKELFSCKFFNIFIKNSY